RMTSTQEARRTIRPSLRSGQASRPAMCQHTSRESGAESGEHLNRLSMRTKACESWGMIHASRLFDVDGTGSAETHALSPGARCAAFGACVAKFAGLGP